MENFTNNYRAHQNNGFMHRITKDVFTLTGLVKIGLLSACAFVLMILSFPLTPIIPFISPWLKLDLSDLPALIGAFAMGPLAAVFIEFIKNLLNIFIKGSDSFGIGELSNFIVGCSFVVPASMIYFRRKTKQRAIVGMVAGIITMTVIACLSNYYVIVPMYMKAGGLPTDFDLKNYILVAVVPFNIIKSTLQSIITVLLYKRISPILHL